MMAVTLAAALAGCGAGPQPAGPAAAGGSGGSAIPVQESAKPAITAAQVSKDVVGRIVAVPELSGAGPGDRWTFEAGEYRRVDIVEQRPTAAGRELLVFMLTRSVPKPREPVVQVSGQLRLHYEWKGGRWVLRRIDNVSFRYSVGVAT
ncbi:MAG: hypothetical protein IT529_13275 [Burkholderiales bacterium]|nr:hypothetical protein [Burkholderiales bacterium]